MQNGSMRYSEGAHNLHEGVSSVERGRRGSVQNSKVRQSRRRASQSGNGSRLRAEARQLTGPPALLEYSIDDADSGEDSDVDEEMDEEYGEQEETAADCRSVNDQSDLSDSESEGEEQQGWNVDGSQLEECSSSHATKLHLTASKHQQRGKDSVRHQSKSRKRNQQEQDCSVNDQFAAEVKRLKESKLKHNKNEQIRRKDMKDAVHKLRNQLRRKTKKPSTISVLKAAKQEIDELTSIKEEEDRELEGLRQKELFLKYQLESLVSEREKLLSSSGAGVVVPPMRFGVEGAGSFVPPPAANPTESVAVPQPIHSRPTLPRLPLFPVVPPIVPRSAAAATSPTAVGRLGMIDHQQPIGGAPPTIFPPTLTSVSRIPLPRPPNLVPFTPTATCTNNLSSTPPSSSTLPGSISIFPASFTPNIIPGVSPTAATAFHVMSPSARPTAQAGLPNVMYRGLASPLLMQYHPAIVGRLPTTAAPGVLGTAGPAGVGRMSINPTLPFCLPTAALYPPPLLGFNRYGTTNPSSQSTTTASSCLQFARRAESMQAHTNNSRSRHSSGDESNVQQTSEFALNTGSKNGNPSAEVCNPHTHSPNNNSGNKKSSREASAEGTQHSSLHTIMARHNSEGTKIQQSNSDDRCGCDASCTDSFHRYSRNGVIRVPENTHNHLLTAAPPLIKVVADLEDSDRSSKKLKLIERIDQQELHEHVRRQQQVSLQVVPALKNAEVISTMIKHLKPQPKAIYVEKEGHNRFKAFRCSRNGEQRLRMSNSLSSGDEAPDSPHQTYNGSEQSTYCCNKLNGWDCLCYSSPAVTNSRECLPAVSHKNLQYNRYLQKKKNGFLRHRQS